MCVNPADTNVITVLGIYVDIVDIFMYRNRYSHSHCGTYSLEIMTLNKISAHKYVIIKFEKSYEGVVKDAFGFLRPL